MRLAVRKDPFSRLRKVMGDDDFFDFAPVDDVQVDVYEEGDNVVVKVKAPGFKKEELEISVQDNTLSVSGNSESSKEEEDVKKHYYVREINQQSFYRSVPMPVKVDQESAKASFKDGILKVSFPKSKEAMPKKINVEI